MNNIEKERLLAEEKILRDYLAIDRTRLANDRTLLAFLRTSLYLMATAVAILELKSLQDLQFLAWMMIAGSVIFLFVGIMSFFRMKKKINRYYQSSQPSAGSSKS